MSNNLPNHSGGQFIPLGQILPWLQQSPSNQPNSYSYQTPPARVQFALEVLQHFTMKTMPRPAINEHQIDWMEKIELKKHEINAEASACNLISEYLNGRLEPNRWEEDSLMEVISEEECPHQMPGRLVDCPSCSKTPQLTPSCGVCGGSGKLMITQVQRMNR